MEMRLVPAFSDFQKLLKNGRPFLKSISNAILLLRSLLLLFCPPFYMGAVTVIIVKIGFIVHITFQDWFV